MTIDEAINWLRNLRADIGKIEHRELWHYEQALEEIMELLKEPTVVDPLENVPTAEEAEEKTMADLIDRQEAISAVNTALFPKINTAKDAEKALLNLPSAQPEPFTDEEQRMFLSAMGREEHICKHVDAVYEDPYEDSLVRICHEIKRKVKGALWT